MRKLLNILLTLTLCAAPGAWAAPEHPGKPLRNPTLVLLAATFHVGGEFPADPACSRPNVICMNPPAYWLEADVIATLYGNAAPGRIVMTGASHYGIDAFKDPGIVHLVLAHADGERYVLVRNHGIRLIQSKSGNQYLIRRSAKSPDWLPCGIDAVQEPLAEQDFDEERMVIEPEGFDNAGVDAHPERFIPTAPGAMPRYGIRLQNLVAYIRKVAAAGQSLTCATAL